MNEEGAPLDSGFDDAGPFSVTPEADGVALDAALREFGPAAFEDLLPRLRALAADLDAAHTEGFIHGRLHPSKVFVTDAATYLIGARQPMVLEDRRHWPIQPPYTAPEVVGGAPPGPTADQYSLAAITYEWMFGRPISGPAERTVDVRAIPNVDRGELARAFTRALTPEPFRRFASCTDFCDAIAAASAPALPLMATADADANDDLAPFLPEASVPPVSQPASGQPFPDEASFVHEPFVNEEPRLNTPEPDIDSFQPAAAPLAIGAIEPEGPVPSWQPAALHERRGQRFGGIALILATIVGAVFGFAAGYMARPRALQSAPPQQVTAPATGNDLKPAGDPAPPPAKSSAATRPPSTDTPDARRAPAVPAPAKAPENIGSLLIRTTPAGARVEVDGAARGETPLALRGLELGTREVAVSRGGFTTERRRIALTKSRPSRSVDIRLTRAAAAPPAPSTPASLGRRPATTGSLTVESRPSGAAVAIDGKPVGVTPLTIADLAPADYHVTMTLPGHQTFATTVRVVAGERARAAARLTEQEQE